jgi:hypothetical protein
VVVTKGVTLRNIKKLGLTRLKKRAPKVPDYTCTEIDNVIDKLEKIFVSKKFSNIALKILIRKLERLRSSNDSLRESGIYWYEVCKDLLGLKQDY